jgi:alpha-tubulin suppressor-like RCC1 family protein
VEGTGFPAGSTSLNVTNLKAARSWVAPMSVIDGTRMAILVSQLSPATSPNGFFYRRLGRFGKITGLDVSPTTPPQPVALVMGDLPQTDGVSLDWNLPAFLGATQTPCTSGGANFQVLGQPGPISFGASPVERKRQYLVMNFPVTAPAISTGPMTFGEAGTAQGAWSVLWQANFNCSVPMAMPGGGTINVGASYTAQGLYGGPGTPASLPGPAISPPRNVRIDGLPLSVPQPGVSNTAVVAWDPPLVGTPDIYRVLLRNHPGGGAASAIVAILLTKDTSLRIPPGLLRNGETYTLVVNAFRGGYTLERPERMSLPFDRANQPGAWFTVAPDRFRVGGTLTGVHVPGLVLSTPGQPNLAIEPKASGFLFATPVPQGTPYAVTIAQLPANQVCTVTNGSGTVGVGDVSNVAVSCRTIEQASDCGDLAEYAVGQRWSYTYTPGPVVTTSMTTTNTPAPYRGLRFIRAVTNAAYGFSMVHTSDAPVDASAFDELRFAVRARNPNQLGWQGNFPVVVLQDAAGNRVTHAPATNLMPTDGATWVPITVPLRGGPGWGASGGADLASVVRIEVYSDTWDFQPLTIDIDGMSFERHGTTCPTGGTAWRQVSAGRYHTAAVRWDGTLWTWGYNANGQVGNGTTIDQPVPVQVGTGFAAVSAGDLHTVAVKADGTLWAWGSNHYGQVGNGSLIDQPSPVQVGTGFAAVAAGGLHTLAIRTDGSLWAWGDGDSGALGIGAIAQLQLCQVQSSEYCSQTPIFVGTGFTAVGAGWAHSMGVKTDGTLWGWGYDGMGQLGLPMDYTPGAFLAPRYVGSGFATVAASDGWHSVALKPDGTVWATGWNFHGQLGDGTEVSQSSLQPVGAGFASIAAGPYDTAAVKQDGTLWTWGNNLYGQIGTGSTQPGHQLTPVAVGTGFASVAVGGFHMVALKTDGTLWAWGAGGFGQLGTGSTSDQYVPVLVGP